MSVKKLALGTVQFGMNYGPNNSKVPSNEINLILQEAQKNGLQCLDTAYAYGTSESELGKYLATHANEFQIISKFPSDSEKSVSQILQESFARLGVSKLYGYLIHHYKTFAAQPEIFAAMQEAKNAKLIDKIGFSLYYPHEVEYLFKNNILFDIVQIPYSMFDQRFSPYLEEFKKRNVEVHVRSVFVQGIVFKEVKNLHARFTKLHSRIDRLHALSAENNVPISAICTNYAVLNPYIHKVVLGVDSVDNFKENIQSINDLEVVKKLREELDSFSESDEDIIVPSHWNKTK